MIKDESFDVHEKWELVAQRKKKQDWHLQSANLAKLKSNELKTFFSKLLLAKFSLVLLGPLKYNVTLVLEFLDIHPPPVTLVTSSKLSTHSIV